MSIGIALAEARRRAGITVTEVSQRTRIREAIVRAIEEDDFAGCGGDFYARGFIRSIARTVGTDPAPLVRDYDAAHRPPAPESANERPQSFVAALPGPRRRTALAVILAGAAAIAVGFASYHLVSSSGPASRVSAEARGSVASGRHHAVSPPAPAQHAAHHRGIVVRIKAAEDCWVEFTAPGGRLMFQSYVAAGTVRRWAFRRAVDMTLGNPGGVTLIVNGRRPLPAGTSHPVTLRLSPHENARP